ncbi:MAG: hypothetical protein AAF195_03590 [Pseudomonadota bacterium]
MFNFFGSNDNNETYKSVKLGSTLCNSLNPNQAVWSSRMSDDGVVFCPASVNITERDPAIRNLAELYKQLGSQQNIPLNRSSFCYDDTRLPSILPGKAITSFKPLQAQQKGLESNNKVATNSAFHVAGESKDTAAKVIRQIKEDPQIVKKYLMVKFKLWQL